MFADQPHFLAAQMLRATVPDALRRAIGNSHANGGEACREQPLGSAPPTDLAPLCYLQHRLRRYGCSVGNVPLAGATTPGDGKNHRHVGGIDFLLVRDADGPCEAACTCPTLIRIEGPHPRKRGEDLPITHKSYGWRWHRF